MIDCQQCQFELDDYLAGEVGGGCGAEIRAHLAICAGCAELRDSIERENRIFSEFSRQTELTPGPDMWVAIRDRLNFDQPTANESWWRKLLSGQAWMWLFSPAMLRQAAFAVVLIAVSVGVTAYLLKRDKPAGPEIARNELPVTVTTPSPSVSPSAPKPAGATPEVQVEKPVRPAPAVRPVSEEELIRRQLVRAEREYQGAIRLLDTAITRRKDRFDPEVMRQYEASLALIDRSIGESKRAFRANPNDLAAGQFLIATYARKVELMQDIAMR